MSPASTRWLRRCLLLIAVIASAGAVATSAPAQNDPPNTETIDGINVAETAGSVPGTRLFIIRSGLYAAGAAGSSDAGERHDAVCRRMIDVANRIQARGQYTHVNRNSYTLLGETILPTPWSLSSCVDVPEDGNPRRYYYLLGVSFFPPGTGAPSARLGALPRSSPDGSAVQTACPAPEQLAGTWAIAAMPSYVVKIESGQFGLNVGVRYPNPDQAGTYVWRGGPGSLRPTRADACFFTKDGAPSVNGMRYDPRTRTISFNPGTRGQASGLTVNKERNDAGLPYARAEAPPPMPIVCAQRDIEGRWRRRGDGMTMEVMTMSAQGGGSSRVISHPRREWPSDVPKMSAIEQTSPLACTYRARCYTLKYNSEGYFGESEACILTYDPDRRMLTASGTHGVYELIAGR